MPNEAITRLYRSPKRWALIALCDEQIPVPCNWVRRQSAAHGIGSPDCADRRSLQTRRLIGGWRRRRRPVRPEIAAELEARGRRGLAWRVSGEMSAATGRERADEIGDVQAKTSCLDVSCQPLKTCKSVAARFAVPPIPLVLLTGGRARQVGRLSTCTKAKGPCWLQASNDQSKADHGETRSAGGARGS